MKYLGMLLLCIVFFSSCLSDEEKRLQTDQTFEGEEIFNLSYSLGEHVFYAFQPYEYYSDTANHSAISGCPLIEIDTLIKEVTLTFGMGECATNKPIRSGKVILTYPDSIPQEEGLIRINYEDYWVRGVKVDGMRFLELVDSTSTSISLMDSLYNYKITDADNSTSKIDGIFTHEVHYAADSLLYFTTSGTGSGRNLTGRPFTMEITAPKQYNGDCLDSGFFVAEGGGESWIIDRSVEADVVHVIAYEQAPDCNHGAHIRLSNGTELVKYQ